MSQNTGWIKIDRAITEHWLWQDAERLKWWLDLLFMANWEDKKTMHDAHLFTLKRGQIIASVAFLCERWEKSNKTVIKYLQMLESEEMIKREVVHRQTPIITICNYELYQDNVQTQVHTQVQTIVHTNKEYKEDNNNIYTTRTRESDYIEELKSSSIWLEQMAMRYHMNVTEIVQRLDDFSLDATCRGNEHSSLNDAKAHFNNWLLKRTENNEQSKSSKRNIQNQRRAFEVTAIAAQDYEGAF